MHTNYPFAASCTCEPTFPEARIPRLCLLKQPYGQMRTVKWLTCAPAQVQTHPRTSPCCFCVTYSASLSCFYSHPPFYKSITHQSVRQCVAERKTKPAFIQLRCPFLFSVLLTPSSVSSDSRAHSVVVFCVYVVAIRVRRAYWNPLVVGGLTCHNEQTYASVLRLFH